MNKKQVIRIGESQLRQIVTESVKRVLREYEERPEEIGKQEDDNYYGGGLPDSHYDEGHDYEPDYEDMEGTPVWEYLCDKLEQKIPNFNWEGVSKDYIYKVEDMIAPLSKISSALYEITANGDGGFRDSEGKFHKITVDDIRRFARESLDSYWWLYYCIAKKLRYVHWLFK